MRKTKSILIAIIFILSGLAMTSWAIYPFIADAGNYKHEIDYDTRDLLSFGPLALSLGIYFLSALLAPVSQTRKRSAAIIFVLLGLAIAWLQIYLPIADASHHKPEIRYSFKRMLLGPLMLLAGIMLFFSPRDAGLNAMRVNIKHKKYRWILAVIYVLLMIGGFYLFKRVISSYGYANVW